MGKTTLLREAARVLADELGKRVVVVDTSNEIAGDGDMPHPGIGRARRMQVARPAEQHRVMIEAVENHMPEVIVIDEIGTELEAQAARTIAERGVQLVGTAHGRTLENLLVNPTLSDLVGGMQAVTLGDEEARRRGTQKTVLERKAPPTFDVLVEQLSWREVIVHRDVAGAVDELLRGQAPIAELRDARRAGPCARRATITVVDRRAGPWGRIGDTPFERDLRAIADGAARRGRRHGGPHGAGAWQSAAGTIRARMPRADEPALGGRRSTRPYRLRGGGADRDDRRRARSAPSVLGATQRRRPAVRIYPFGISRERLEQSARQLRVPVEISTDQAQADAVITLKTYYRAPVGAAARGGGRAQAGLHPAHQHGRADAAVPRAHLRSAPEPARRAPASAGSNPTMQAMQEAEDAIHRMLNHGIGHAGSDAAERLCAAHAARVAERYNLESRSFGKSRIAACRSTPAKNTRGMHCAARRKNSREYQGRDCSLRASRPSCRSS